MVELFVIVLVADFLLLFGVVFSIVFPKRRIWPPPKKSSWQFRITWFFSTIGMVGSPLLGLIDFNSLWDLHWIYFLTGFLSIGIGSSIAIWGSTTLSWHQSLGLKGKVVTEGPYQYTRNPQYLGFISVYAGIILITSSFMVLVTGTIVIITFVILPFSEEPWLLEQYGKAYKAYCENVPRFIGLRTFKLK